MVHLEKGSNDELLEINLYDSLKIISVENKNHIKNTNSLIGYDRYSLNKEMFPDGRTVNIAIFTLLLEAPPQGGKGPNLLRTFANGR